MKAWLIGAMVAMAVALGACQTGAMVHKTAHEVPRFDRATLCLVTEAWDSRIREEQVGRPPMTYYGRPQTWSDDWLRLLAGSGLDSSPAYVDYLVEHRRDAGLPDLPGHPSAGVYSSYDCNAHFVGQESVSIKGGMAEWTRLPTLNQVRAVFPAAAVAAQRDGFVKLNCVIQPDGHLSGCQVANEIPAGMGFGAAALKLAPYYKVKAWGRARTPDLPVAIGRDVWFPMHACLPQGEAHYGRPCGSE